MCAILWERECCLAQGMARMCCGIEGLPIVFFAWSYVVTVSCGVELKVRVRSWCRFRIRPGAAGRAGSVGDGVEVDGAYRRAGINLRRCAGRVLAQGAGPRLLAPKVIGAPVGSCRS